MDGQQGAVAEGADELEVICSCRGVAFPDPTGLAILATGRTIYEPSSEIRNVSVDGHRHISIIQFWEADTAVAFQNQTFKVRS